MSIINGTRIILTPNEHTLALTTYSRQHGGSQRFLILRDRLEGLQDGESFIDADIYSFMAARKKGAKLLVEITWLSGMEAHVYGHVERIAIPYDLVTKCLNEDTPVKCLHHENRAHAKLDFSCAGRTIREICTKKRVKRAFLKGISRDFRWKQDETIHFFNDGGSNFFFREGERRCMCGGFILHHDVKPKRPGEQARTYFSMHT